MAHKDWDRERDFVMGVALDLVMVRGYEVEGVAESMTRLYYRGISPERAQRSFSRDLHALVNTQKRLVFERESRVLVTMAHALQAEGWRWLTMSDRPGGFFWHDQYGSVNNMGGGFGSWDEAVRRTFNSEIRALTQHRRGTDPLPLSAESEGVQ